MSKFAIQRCVKSLTIASSGTTVTGSSFYLNGLLKGIIVDAPDLTSSNTYTVTVKDASGYTIYTKASLVKNTVTPAFIDANNQPLELPLSGNHTITLTSSGTEGSNRVFSVVLLVAR